MSGKILQTIIDDGHIKDDALDNINMKRVQDLIVGSCPNHQPPTDGALPLNDKRFLFDIVANGRNSIDVDKFDYLARDSHYCNVKVSCDLQRLRQLTKVDSAARLMLSFHSLLALQAPCFDIIRTLNQNYVPCNKYARHKPCLDFDKHFSW